LLALPLLPVVFGKAQKKFMHHHRAAG